MNAMSSMRRDFVATHLRSQVDRLNTVLGDIENQGATDCEYTRESLKEIEINIRQIRKSCENN